MFSRPVLYDRAQDIGAVHKDSLRREPQRRKGKILPPSYSRILGRRGRHSTSKRAILLPLTPAKNTWAISLKGEVRPAEGR